MWADSETPPLMQKICHSHNRADIFANLGLAMRQQSRYLPAIRHLAIETLRNTIIADGPLNVPQTFDTAIRWARLAFADGLWDEAVEAYQAASEAAERLYRIQMGYRAKARILEGTQGLAADLAYCFARLGRLDEAVTAIESGIARLLADSLARKQFD